MPDVQLFTNVRKCQLPVPHAQLLEADIKVLGRLPHGMTSGNSTIAIYARLKEPLVVDGELKTHVFVETSLRIFNTAVAAFAAAEEHNKHAGGN